MEGTVVKIFLDKGYGFVRPADGGENLFFHLRDIDQTLEWGEHLRELRVCYAVKQTDRGPRAVDVRAAL